MGAGRFPHLGGRCALRLAVGAMVLERWWATARIGMCSWTKLPEDSTNIALLGQTDQRIKGAAPSCPIM